MSTTLSPKAFSPYDVPPTGTERSRFPAGHSPGGHIGRPDQVYAGLLSHLLDDRQKAQPEVLPTAVEVELFKVIRTNPDGRYLLVERPGVKAVPSRHNTRPGKFAAVKAKGTELLNDFFLGGEAWEKARDVDVWEALLAAATETQAQGHALRTMNDLTAAALLARAGIIVHPHNLRWE